MVKLSKIRLRMHSSSSKVLLQNNRIQFYVTNFKKLAVKFYIPQFSYLSSLQQDTVSQQGEENNSSFLSSVCKQVTTAFTFLFFFHHYYSIEQMEIALLLLLLFLSPPAASLDYTFSLNYPFLLRNDYMGISSVTRDINNEVLMFLQNNQVRRYSADLTSYVIFNTPDLVFKCSSDSFSLSNVQLSNGTTFTMQGRVTTTISRTYTTVKTYSYPTFTLLSDYQGSETIMDYKTIALQSPSSDTPINIIVGSLTVKVYYRNQILTVFDYAQIFGANVACTAARYTKLFTSYGIDFISSNLNFYVALSSNIVIDLTITLSQEFNFTRQNYDLAPSTFYTQITSLSSPANKIIFKNGIMFMQEGNGLITASDSIGNSPVIIDATIPTAALQDTIFKDNRWYLLYNNQIIQVNYQALSGFSLLSLLANYASKQYTLVVGLNFDLIYIAGESYIYKMGYCLGESYFDGVACSNYSCFDTKCSNCWMHSNPCGNCLHGYPRTDNYQCSGSPPNTTINSIPTSNTTNSTNATASTNSTNNSTNNTLPINTTSVNGTISSDISLITVFLSGRGEEFFTILSNILKFSISLPSGRRIVYPLFYFFGNFDDIYLYSFHDAFYGRVAEGLFSDISQIQNAKWSIVEKWDTLSFIFGQDSQIRRVFSYRSKYLSYSYNLESKAKGSQGIFCNSYDFFFFSLPLSVVLFLMLRAAYKCFKRYAISRIFRMFSLWGFIFLLNFDGNIQQFTFYLFAEIKNVLFFSFTHKVIIVTAVLFGFIVLILSFGGYFVGLMMYRRLNRSLTDNNRNSMRGNTELLFQNCMRNFLLGVVHSLVRYAESKHLILSFLLVLEIVFQGLFVLQSTRRVFKVMHKFWFYSMLSFTRIVLIVTFYFQHRSSYASLLEEIQIALILTNIGIYILSVVTLLCETVYEMLAFLSIIIHLNRPVESNSPLEGTIKSRIFILRQIARQNQARRQANIFEGEGLQRRGVHLEQLSNQHLTKSA